MYIALYSVRNKVKDWSLFSRQVALTNKSPLASLAILRYKKSRTGGGGGGGLGLPFRPLPPKSPAFFNEVWRKLIQMSLLMSPRPENSWVRHLQSLTHWSSFFLVARQGFQNPNEHGCSSSNIHVVSFPSSLMILDRVNIPKCQKINSGTFSRGMYGKPISHCWRLRVNVRLSFSLYTTSIKSVILVMVAPWLHGRAHGIHIQNNYSVQTRRYKPPWSRHGCSSMVQTTQSAQYTVPPWSYNDWTQDLGPKPYRKEDDQKANTYNSPRLLGLQQMLGQWLLPIGLYPLVCGIGPRTLNREVPGSNLLAATVAPFGKILYLHCLVPIGKEPLVPCLLAHKHLAFLE